LITDLDLIHLHVRFGGQEGMVWFPGACSGILGPGLALGFIPIDYYFPVSFVTFKAKSPGFLIPFSKV